MINTEISTDFDDPTEESYDFPMWSKMAKDIRSIKTSFDRDSVRDLVSTYYRTQDTRIAVSAQARELSKSGSPHELLDYVASQYAVMEKAIKNPLQQYAESEPVGQWALSQYGIGPVITAGLLSHIDIEKAPTAGAIWRYAGLDPTAKWEKGQKRPWNADLKVLTWKIGQSFMKFSKKDECFYGKLYIQDKQRRTENNETGVYGDRAKSILDSKNWRANQSRAALESGKLPLAQIDAQARRFAVKIFLSHLHAVWFETHYSKSAPTPYTIAHKDHVHMIVIPNYTPIKKV